MTRPLSRLVAIGMLLALPAAAQLAVLRISEPAPVAVGSALCGIGDFDGDGVADLATGGTRVGIYSGATGGLLASIAVAVPSPDGVAGPGDVNGDGVPEIAVGEAGVAIRLYSGATLSPLWSVLPPAGAAATFGDHVRCVADGDGDGIRDLAVHLAIPPGWFLVSSATGTVIPGFASPAPVRDAGDVNGDGLPDYAAGSSIVSGAPGFPLLVAALPMPGVLPGTWSTQFSGGLGDVNGDGFDDVGQVFGDGVSAGCQLHFGPAAVPAGPFGANYGALYDLAPLGDVDGDGRDEFLRSDYGCVFNSCSPGYVRVLSAGTGIIIRSTFPGDDGAHAFGLRVARLGDLNGDGLADFAASAWPGFQAPGDPYVRVFHGTSAVVPAAATTLYAGFGTPLPFTFVPYPLLGTTFRFTLYGTVTPGSPALLFGSLPVAQPLVLAAGGEAWIDPSSLFEIGAAMASGTPGSTGSIGFPVPIPPLAALLGTTLNVQAVAVDPSQTSGYVLSSAYRLVLGNSL